MQSPVKKIRCGLPLRASSQSLFVPGLGTETGLSHQGGARIITKIFLSPTTTADSARRNNFAILCAPPPPLHPPTTTATRFTVYFVGHLILPACMTVPQGSGRRFPSNSNPSATTLITYLGHPYPEMSERQNLESQWIFTEEELLRTPSVLDGISPELEREQRGKGCNFILQMGIQLKLPQLTLATASVFLHRFYMQNSLKKHHYYVGLPVFYPYRCSLCCLLGSLTNFCSPRKPPLQPYS